MTKKIIKINRIEPFQSSRNFIWVKPFKKASCIQTKVDLRVGWRGGVGWSESTRALSEPGNLFELCSRALV